MTTKLVVGLDGHGSGERALAYAERLAKLIGDCELMIVYVVEWSPYSFQTAEENAQRHKRREEEISTATQRIIDPAVARVQAAGLKATGKVRHGDVASILMAFAEETNAEQIIVSRSSEGGFAKRIFGSATSNLVMHASVPPVGHPRHVDGADVTGQRQQPSLKQGRCGEPLGRDQPVRWGDALVRVDGDYPLVAVLGVGAVCAPSDAALFQHLAFTPLDAALCHPNHMHVLKWHPPLRAQIYD